DEAKAVLPAGGVERVALELHDRDDALPLRPPPRLAQADRLALVVADLGARRDGRAREQSLARVAALRHEERVVDSPPLSHSRIIRRRGGKSNEESGSGKAQGKEDHRRRLRLEGP